MPIKEVSKGLAFIIYAWGSLKDRIVLSDFMEKLAKDGHKDLPKILRLIRRISQEGMIRNPDFVKKLTGGIFEFRANSIRIFWFYDGNRIVCTHGIIKKTQKTPKKEIETAISVKERYFKEKEG